MKKLCGVRPRKDSKEASPYTSVNSLVKCALGERMVKERGSNLKVSATTDRRAALPGADVVVTTIAVGGRRAWENDVFIPRKYGIYQPVGDTTMPGGISCSLRMIPVMAEITRDVIELCPEASSSTIPI